jgi:hypothetical protein
VVQALSVSLSLEEVRGEGKNSSAASAERVLGPSGTEYVGLKIVEHTTIWFRRQMKTPGAGS